MFLLYVHAFALCTLYCICASGLTPLREPLASLPVSPLFRFAPSLTRVNPSTPRVKHINPFAPRSLAPTMPRLGSSLFVPPLSCRLSPVSGLALASRPHSHTLSLSLVLTHTMSFVVPLASRGGITNIGAPSGGHERPSESSVSPVRTHSHCSHSATTHRIRVERRIRQTTVATVEYTAMHICHHYSPSL